MRYKFEDDCTNLVKLLPSTEAALLDWAINLMADVVEHEKFNKMDARNIAVVFAPNMTQMADPLTALIHAVQVMNFLKTLILKTLQERDESAAKPMQLSSCLGSFPPIKFNKEKSCEQTEDACVTSKFPRTTTLGRIEWCIEEKLWSNEENENGIRKCESESVSSGSTPSRHENCSLENRYRGSKYESDHWLRLRKLFFIKYE
ncbi:PREDICTED: rho GTPase-activating protein 3-like [Lupinus angustifolius]|uniref:rho GTPase-activating protein 3-like n=1 Tax=Lupinus angustifolius TaxID=3871 RepID=UPI00092E5D27|nr:PREDICTED: rho GTPase-activating protein 3-like [Lupinus angustifolius]